MLSFVSSVLKIFASFLLFFGLFGFGSEVSKLFSDKASDSAITGISLSLLFVHAAYKIFRYNVNVVTHSSSFKNSVIATVSYLLFYFGFFAIFNSIDNSIYRPEKYNGFLDWFLSLSLMGFGGFLLYKNKKAPVENPFESVIEKTEKYEQVRSKTTTDSYGNSAVICPGCSARNPCGTKVCIYCGNYI
jgi:divalent metal cation (Fe/Co/Zn/Cd) transporter